MKTFIELYEALERGDVKLNEGICLTVDQNLPAAKSMLCGMFHWDWHFNSPFKPHSSHLLSIMGEWDSTRKNLLLLLACYDNEI